MKRYVKICLGVFVAFQTLIGLYVSWEIFLRPADSVPYARILGEALLGKSTPAVAPVQDSKPDDEDPVSWARLDDAVPEDFKSYGNCAVVTTRRRDEPHHTLRCHDGDLAVNIITWQGGLLVGLETEGSGRAREVGIRVDKDELFWCRVFWDGPNALLDWADSSCQVDTRQLLHDLAHGQRVSIFANQGLRRFSLTGARAAVDDFARRAELSLPALYDSANSKLVDQKTYGNCRVLTEAAPSRLPYHTVYCNNPRARAYGRIDIRSYHGRLVVVPPPPPTEIRVDNGEVIRLSPSSSDGLIHDHDLAFHLLDELAHGQRAVLKSGANSAVIPLNGANRAINDFRRRASL